MVITYKLCRILLAIPLLLSWLPVWGQGFTVKGKVTDQDSSGMPGVNVVVKGTSNGTVTDTNGDYSLAVDENDVLVFSFIGFETMEMPVNSQSTLNVSMEASLQTLGEVVVIGYGDQRKRAVTGAISSVKTEDIVAVPSPNFQAALQGRTPGVLINQRGGDPRGTFNVLIRGINSVTLSSQPLYVVDGVPLYNTSLYHINPDDVEQLDVLKDASATAIYGARAANGVVIITTKSGKKGKTTFDFSIDYGIQTPSNNPEMTNSIEYASIWDTGRVLRGQPTEPAFTDPAFFNTDNDHVDLITRDAPWSKYSLTATGGSEKAIYAISGSYENRDGIIENTDFQRASLRTNIDLDISNKFKVGTRLAFSSYWGANTTNDIIFGGANSTYINALFAKPWMPVYDENGNFLGIPNTTGPYAGFSPAPVHNQILNERDLQENRLLGSVYAEYKILDGLSFRTSFGGDIFYADNYALNPVFNFGAGDYQRLQNSVSRSSVKNVNWVADQTLTYSRIFEKHAITALIGYSAQNLRESDLQLTRSGATSNNFDQLNQNQPIVDVATAGSTTPIESSLASYFGRIQYDFDDKYLATATVRRDASSKFGANNRWGTFPSFSIGWRLSSEPFLQNSIWLNDLKLRASWGQSGNQSFYEYARYATIGSTSNIFGVSSTLGTLENNNLKWETAEQIDIGLDATLFDNKLSITFDYFDKTNRDLLISRPVLLATGIDDPVLLQNFGELSNKGFEFGLGGDVMLGGVSWQPYLTITTYKNKVDNIGRSVDGTPERIFGAAQPNAGSINLTEEGEPVGVFYGLLFDGIYQSGEAIEITNPGVAAGDFKFVDLDGNGLINSNDRTVIGNPNPDFFGGFNNNFRYKGFNLAVLATFSIGNDIYNVYKQYGISGYPGFNSLEEFTDHWSDENPSNEYPKPFSAVHFTHNSLASSYFVEDGSYFRIKNISFGYDLPRSFLTPLNIQRANISFIGTNLFTFTSYSGIDPENNSGNSAGNQLSQGLDIVPYPFSKSYMLRLTVSL